MAGGRRGPGALAEPRRLMRSGLGLIVLGHGSLVLGAIVHGSVLRHVAGARRVVTPEYAAANVVSVCSGLLSIAAGIVAILVSHNLSRAALVSAGLRAGGGSSARPCPARSRSPGPWPRGFLPPRRRLPVSPVSGPAPPAAPGGRQRRPRAEAAAGSGVPGLAGWADTGWGAPGRAGLGWAGLGAPGTPPSPCGVSTEPEEGVRLCGVHGRVKDAKSARPSSEGRAEPSWKGQEMVCAPSGERFSIGARPERFPELLPVPPAFLPPAALDPAEHFCAELPPVHGVQRGAGAGHRPHGAQPGHAPGQGLQQLRAASGCPGSHCDQRVSLQHHAHLRHSPGTLVSLLAAGSCRSRALRQVLFSGSRLPGHRALCTQLWQRAAGQAKYSSGEATP
ncbi:keratinocyte-associated protein 3 isoform X2 [Poecile atricapillus]|uniref:keratinocyte-associated protein 3 isoform X2 n=1 Tax=Poecile atricapillus TaxID=48891 RepID=UPI002739AC66|nr:keratinocyte-associated protein 3 isoform X2 [Poecile atricapillus]